MNIEKGKLKNALSEYQQFKREEQERIEKAHWKRREFLKRFGLFGLDVMLYLMVFVEIIAGIKNRGIIFLSEFIGAFVRGFLFTTISALIATLGRINKLQKGDLALLSRITLALLTVPGYVLPFFYYVNANARLCLVGLIIFIILIPGAWKSGGRSEVIRLFKIIATMVIIYFAIIAYRSFP